MDCDDEVGLVKRNYYAHADSPDVSGVPRLAERIAVNADWMAYDALHIRHRSLEAP